MLQGCCHLSELNSPEAVSSAALQQDGALHRWIVTGSSHHGVRPGDKCSKQVRREAMRGKPCKAADRSTVTA